jgi:hypothetical protein
MILALQNAKLDNSETLVNVKQFQDFLQAMHKKDVEFVYRTVYSGKFDMQGFVRFFFRRLFERSQKLQINKLAEIANLLADIEKSWTIGVTYEIIFLSNITKIMSMT